MIVRERLSYDKVFFLIGKILFVFVNLIKYQNITFLKLKLINIYLEDICNHVILKI